MPPDDVRGYDVRTGKLLWTFHVVPRKGEFGNDTWLNDSWTYSGNSGAWSLLSADEELGYVYLPFEEATGDYYGGTRPGNNLFAESIVCLDARTGKRVWHFQTIHHGLWDYDLPAAPVLGDITVNGRRIKAVAQVSKQAFVYVFDRVTGQPVWPIVERPVPQGDVPGEWYSPTQPIPSKPPAFDQQGVSDNDLIDFTPELKAEAKKIVSEYKTGPIYTPPVLLGSPDGPKGLLLVPGTNGGADWGGAAFDPETGMLYVPSAHMPTVIALGKSQHPESTLPYVKQQVPWPFGPQGLPDPFKPPYSRLVAIDLNKGDIAWSVANGDGLRNHPAFKGLNLPPLGTPGRLARARHQELRVHGRRERQRRRPAAWRSVGRQEVPRVRQEDRRDRVGDGIARRRQQCADDLHGQRQAVHRRRGSQGASIRASSSRWRCRSACGNSELRIADADDFAARFVCSLNSAF